MSDHAALASVSCLNCGHVLAPPAHYCSQCGQAPAHRLSTGHVLHELAHVFTHTDKGILAYLPQLLLRPGHLFADYRAGRRKHYFNPFQFLLLFVGFATAAAALLHYYDAVGETMQQQFARRPGFSAERVARVGEYFRYVGKFYNLWWLLLLLPLYSLITWGVYYRRGLNYAESFFLHVLTGGAYHFILTLTLLALWALGSRADAGSNAASSVQIIVILIYLVLIGRQGLKLSWGGAMWRAGLVVLLGAMVGVGLNYLFFGWYVFWR